MVCQECGSPTVEGSTFCMSCGARLGPKPSRPGGRRRLLLLGGLLLLLLAAIAGGIFAYRAWRQSRDRAQHYGAGIAALEAGDYGTAVRELAWVVEQRPEYKDARSRLSEAQDKADWAALYAQAQDRCSRQDWEAAIGLLELLQTRASGYQADAVTVLLVTAYRNSGLAYVQRGEFVQAVQRFDQCLALAPDAEVETQKLLAMIYPQGLAALEQGDADTAIELLEQVYAAEPGYGDLAAKLSSAHLAACTERRGSGDLDGAEAECLAAYRLQPEGPAAPQLTQVALQRTPTATPTNTPSPTPTATLTLADTPTPTSTNTPKPPVCRKADVRTIVFRRQSRCDAVSGAGCGPVEIWVMNADGSNQKRICNPKGYDWALQRDRTSNDGTWRLETYGWQNDIYQIYLGTDRRDLIIYNWAKDWDPSLSADNWWLAWVTNRNANDEIYIKTIDWHDENQRRLTVNTWEWDKHPSWSPDGRQIAFYSNRADKLNEATRQIWIMDVVNDQGVNLRNVSNNPGKVDTDPVWVKWPIP